MCDKIIVEIPAETITTIMSALDDCNKSNDDMWKEIGHLKRDVSFIKDDIEKIKEVQEKQKKRRFLLF